MDLKHLSENLDTLLDYMDSHGYSKSYVSKIRSEADWIFEHAPESSWTGYQDIYEQYVLDGLSDTDLHNCRTVLNLLSAFDENGKYPDGRHTDSIFVRGAYGKLIPEFKELVDYSAAAAKARGLNPSSVKVMTSHVSCFFFAMQERGCRTVDSIQELDVLSFFIDGTVEDFQILRGRSYMKDVRTMLRDGLGWRDGACKKLLDYLPETKGITKNVQFLTESEVDSIKGALGSSMLSRRNTAIGYLLLATGMRISDVAGLKLSSLDWNADLISLKQQKTGAPLELPLTSEVGNSIYDYLTYERPKVDSEYVFLTDQAPYQRMCATNVDSIVSKIFDKAGIRLSPGDRRGGHLFRYHLATDMLERGAAQPVISAALGQQAPSSLNPYIQADLAHLKKPTLDISRFPVRKGVFEDED